jgi:hypothetical protein
VIKLELVLSSILLIPYVNYILNNCLLLLGTISSVGIRESASAKIFSRPFICSMVNSNCDKNSNHLALRRDTVALVYMYVRATWSVNIVNLTPIKKCLHRSRHWRIATYSRSVAE